MSDPSQAPAPGPRQPCELCSRAGAAPPRAPKIGRAFEECWRCGSRVLRPGITEWDFHAPSARRRILAGRAAFVALGGLVVPLAHVAVTLTTTRAWRMRDALLGLAAGWVAIGLWEAARLFGEIHRSRRRVKSDPMYCARLVQQGIDESRAERAEPAGHADRDRPELANQES